MIIFLTQKTYTPALNNLIKYINVKKPDLKVVKVKPGKDTKLTTALNGKEKKLIIRYGTTAFGASEKKVDRVLNSAKAVSGSSDKYGSLNVLDKAGVPVAPHATVGDFLTSKATQDKIGFPCLARNFSHFGGKDIAIIQSKTGIKNNVNLLNKDYVLRLIKNTREFRTFAFKSPKEGKYTTIRTVEKIYKGEGKPPKAGKVLTKADIVKNYKSGYRYEYSDDIPDRVRELGRKATEALGLDFAAVDIIQDLDNPDNFYVLEANTAPGNHGNENTISRLCDKFIATHDLMYAK